MSEHVTNGLTWRSGVVLDETGVGIHVRAAQQMLACLGVQAPRTC